MRLSGQVNPVWNMPKQSISYSVFYQIIENELASIEWIFLVLKLDSEFLRDYNLSFNFIFNEKTIL